MRSPRTYLKIILGGAFLAVVLAYSLYQSRFLILGPGLEIFMQTEGTTVTDSLVLISGSVSNASFIYLDDRQIFADEQKMFHEILPASVGYNILTLRVKDAFGRVRQVTREFIYKPLATTESATTTLKIKF